MLFRFQHTELSSKCIHIPKYGLCEQQNMQTEGRVLPYRNKGISIVYFNNFVKKNLNQYLFHSPGVSWELTENTSKQSFIKELECYNQFEIHWCCLLIFPRINLFYPPFTKNYWLINVECSIKCDQRQRTQSIYFDFFNYILLLKVNQ